MQVCPVEVGYKFITLKIVPKTQIGKYPRSGVQSICILPRLHSYLGIKLDTPANEIYALEIDCLELAKYCKVKIGTATLLNPR